MGHSFNINCQCEPLVSARLSPLLQDTSASLARAIDSLGNEGVAPKSSELLSQECVRLIELVTHWQWNCLLVAAQNVDGFE